MKSIYRCTSCPNEREESLEADVIEARECDKCKGTMDHVFVIEKDKEPKLLTIELDTLDSIPTVYYKGEEINLKTKIEFFWKTQRDDLVIGSSPFINIEHFVKEGNNKHHHLKRIGWNESEPKYLLSFENEKCVSNIFQRMFKKIWRSKS